MYIWFPEYFTPDFRGGKSGRQLQRHLGGTRAAADPLLALRQDILPRQDRGQKSIDSQDKKALLDRMFRSIRSPVKESAELQRQQRLEREGPRSSRFPLRNSKREKIPSYLSPNWRVIFPFNILFPNKEAIEAVCSTATSNDSLCIFL